MYRHTQKRSNGFVTGGNDGSRPKLYFITELYHMFRGGVDSDKGVDEFDSVGFVAGGLVGYEVGEVVNAYGFDDIGLWWRIRRIWPR